MLHVGTQHFHLSPVLEQNTHYVLLFLHTLPGIITSVFYTWCPLWHPFVHLSCPCYHTLNTPSTHSFYSHTFYTFLLSTLLIIIPFTLVSYPPYSCTSYPPLFSPAHTAHCFTLHISLLRKLPPVISSILLCSISPMHSSAEQALSFETLTACLMENSTCKKNQTYGKHQWSIPHCHNLFSKKIFLLLWEVKTVGG